MTAKHSIKAVAKKTGLSPFVIRAWERRYKAVIPERTPTNRRLYSDQDIEKLILLSRAKIKGESISQVAGLSADDLKTLIGVNGLLDDGFNNGAAGNIPSEIETIDRYLELTANLDRDGLYGALLGAEARFSKPVLLENIIIPFLWKIGERWQDGSLKIVHEHLASAVLRSFLGELLISYKYPETAPSIISTTLSGQHHEFGAIIATLTAISEGWRGIFAGPNLPANEIAYSVGKNRAKAIALSLVYSPDDSQFNIELHKLRRLIGDEIIILAGGRMVEKCRSTLNEINAVIVRNMTELRAALRDIGNTGSFERLSPAI